MDNQMIEGFRLSLQQLQLWTIEQERGARFSDYCLLRFDGALESSELFESIQRVVSRFEILRTQFRQLPGMGMPLQVINAADCRIVREEIDLSGLDAEHQRAAIEEQLEQARNTVFNLENDPPLKTTLIRLASNQHMLLLSVYAGCVDAVSFKVLVQGICQAYKAPLAEDPKALQYADVAQWQEELLESVESEIGREYWEASDKKNLPLCTLPHKRRTGLKTNTSYACKYISLESVKTTWAHIADECISSFLLACWRALIWKTTRQDDFLIGVTINGRRYDELKSAVGLFSRTLPERIHVNGNLTLDQIAKKSAALKEDLEKWQEYWIPPAQFYFPLCYEFIELAESRMVGEVEMEVEREYVSSEEYEVKLVVVRRGEEIWGELHYDGGKYEAGEIERVVERYETVVEEGVRREGEGIGKLRMIGRKERKQVEEWGRGESKEGEREEASVVEVLAMRVKEMGEEVAVESEGKRISYRELNRRAEEVARRLRERGVKREEIVGLSVARSVEMVVGIVGIWKAGGAYLPLDPSYPGERLRYMVEDSGARVILSSGGEVEWIGKERCEVVGLEEEVGGEKERKEVKEGGGRGDAGAAAEEERIEPEQLAYVIYTSGSTGKPKGVGVEHRQLMSYVRGISRRLGLKKGMRYGMVSTYAADLGYTMLFPALCTGGCVDVVGAERVLDAWKMEEHWGKRPVDCLKIVPSHLKALMRSGSGKEEELLPREWLVLGGEASSWELMEEIRKLRPKCRVMNHYGPTETTVGELTYEVREVKEERGEEGEGGEKEEGRERGTVPLGRPLGNGAVYVLDEEMEVVGIGMEGEIYLGGGGVARGYVKRGDLTAERFVANPFSERGGERLYRSGDRGRWLESGEVEFLGRKDDQVKIRGNRIELGEIEEALREHAGIREAVVVAREEGGTGGEKRLVGYVVLRGGGRREEEERGRRGEVSTGERNGDRAAEPAGDGISV